MVRPSVVENARFLMIEISTLGISLLNFIYHTMYFASMPELRRIQEDSVAAERLFQPKRRQIPVISFMRL